MPFVFTRVAASLFSVELECGVENEDKLNQEEAEFNTEGNIHSVYTSTQLCLGLYCLSAPHASFLCSDGLYAILPKVFGRLT